MARNHVYRSSWYKRTANLACFKMLITFQVDSVALVFQQYEVLDSNLDQPINCFCGDMNTDLWGKSTWQGHLKENMVIVCTAEILYQCLMRSFIHIDSINLLIFDEAHHAKKNHPYARYAAVVLWLETMLIVFRIIKDFYISEDDRLNRPKIFGMTASPVDVRSNFTQAAKYSSTACLYRSTVLIFRQGPREHATLSNCHHCRSRLAQNVSQSTK